MNILSQLQLSKFLHVVAFYVIISLLAYNILLAKGSTPHPNQNQPISAGDLIQVNLEEDASFTYEGRVGADGRINLPYVGEYLIADTQVRKAQLELIELLEEKYYKKASLTIRILEQAPAAIYVYGAVKEPGLLELPVNGYISMTQALTAVKGLTSWADVENAYILRRSESGEEVTIPVNIREQLLNKVSESSLSLKDQDEFFIPGLSGSGASILLTSDPVEVIIVGQVRSPGVIKFAPGEEATLMRAVFKAGGLTRFAKGDAIKLIRYAGQSRQVDLVNLEVVIEEGFLEKDQPLLPGDMVIVPQKFINF